MRAVVLRAGHLQVREIPDPTPGSGELLLRVLSTAICASDVHFMDHPELGLNDPTGRSLYDTGQDVVLGHEDLDPTPSIGMVVGLDDVPDALDMARRSAGPARIILHPNGVAS